MRKIIIISICLFIGALTLSAQQTVYVIDNETVENFDGSQLKGRIVRDYKITTKGSGRRAVTVHAITTSPSVFSVSGRFSLPDSLKTLHVRGYTRFGVDSVLVTKDMKVIQPTNRKVVYIIDGKEYDDMSAFQTISPFDVENITVLKGGTPEQKEKYGEDVSVIVVTTKKDKSDLSSLLKKMPGVKIDEDGRVTVNGEAINKIKINGTTLMLNGD